MPTPTAPRSPAPKPGINSPMGSLRSAARAGDWTEVLRLVDREGGDVNAELGTRRRTLIQRAAWHGDIDLMRKLHNRGARIVGVEDSEGFNIAFSAVNSSQRTAVKINVLDWLREKGLDLSERGGQNQQSLLHIAAQRQDAALMDYLLTVGVNPNIEDRFGNTPLMILAERSPTGPTRANNHRMMHMLIDKGARLDHVNRAGQTPVLVAMRYDSYLPNAQLLLDAGATLDNPRMPHSLENMLKHHNKSNSTESYPYSYPYGGGGGGNTAGNVNPKIQQFINQRRALPTIDLDSYFRKDALFEQNEHGLTPLDNPETWKNLEAIAEVLERRRDPLTRDDLLGANPTTKKPYLQRAIECRSLGYVLPVLDARGQWIEPRDFAAGEKGQQLNVMGQAAFEAGTMQREVFCEEAWNGRTVNELRTFFNDLPPALKQDVGNLHQLSASLKRQQDRDRRAEAGAGRG